MPAQAAEQPVDAAVGDGKGLPSAGYLVQGLDAVTCPFVAEIGQRAGKSSSAAAQVSAAVMARFRGAGQVVQVAGHRVGGPDRKTVRKHDDLNVRAEVTVLAGVLR